MSDRGNEPLTTVEPFQAENLRTFMRMHWSKQGTPLSPGERLGGEIADFIHASAERHARKETPFLDLWVAILDECNSWLISLLGSVHRPDEILPPINDYGRSVLVLLGKLIADTTALRHLIKLGFDGAARTLLRSIAEYMQELVAIIYDPSLAKAFVSSDTPEAANRFYFNHLARGRLGNRIEQLWQRLLVDGDKDATRFFAGHQRAMGTLLSGTTHPSFAGGNQAMIGFIEAVPDENWLGQWGARSHMSVMTISIYVGCLLPLLLLSDFPFDCANNWTPRLISYDPQDDLHRHVKLGRPVLTSLILSLSDEENARYIYPPELGDARDDEAVLA